MDVVARRPTADARRLRTLPAPDNFLVFAPQWDFLDFLAAEARPLPGFELRMATRGDTFIEEDGRSRVARDAVRGRHRGPRTPDVAADGRGSAHPRRRRVLPTTRAFRSTCSGSTCPSPPTRLPPTLGYFDRPTRWC